MNKWKKRMICSMATVSILSAIPVKAEGTQTITQDTTNKESTKISLYSNVGSTYTVKLPTSVDVTAKEKSVDVVVNGDIASNEKVIVEFPSTATLSDGAGTSTYDDITLTFDATSSALKTKDYLAKELQNAGSTGVPRVAIIKHDNAIPAGKWSATATVKISLGTQ